MNDADLWIHAFQYLPSKEKNKALSACWKFYMYKEDPRVLVLDLNAKEKQDYSNLNGFRFLVQKKPRTKEEKIR